MDMKQIAVWVLQWALLEVGKKFPKVGTWIKDHAPAALLLLSGVIEVLMKAVGVAQADTGVPVALPGGIPGDVLTNYLGTLLVDNVVKKIIWKYLLGKVFKLKAAQAKVA